jgi:capsid protein
MGLKSLQSLIPSEDIDVITPEDCSGEYEERKIIHI